MRQTLYIKKRHLFVNMKGLIITLIVITVYSSCILLVERCTPDRQNTTALPLLATTTPVMEPARTATLQPYESKPQICLLLCRSRRYYQHISKALKRPNTTWENTSYTKQILLQEKQS